MFLHLWKGGSAIRSKNGKGKKVPSAEYEVDNFAYDEEKDVYICPENQILKRITERKEILRSELAEFAGVSEDSIAEI